MLSCVMYYELIILLNCNVLLNVLIRGSAFPPLEGGDRRALRGTSMRTMTAGAAPVAGTHVLHAHVRRTLRVGPSVAQHC